MIQDLFEVLSPSSSALFLRAKWFAVVASDLYASSGSRASELSDDAVQRLRVVSVDSYLSLGAPLVDPFSLVSTAAPLDLSVQVAVSRFDRLLFVFACSRGAVCRLVFTIGLVSSVT